MTTLFRPAAEPWIAVVVQVAAARKVQRLAATGPLPRLAGADNMTASACAPARRPTAAGGLISLAAGSAREPWSRKFLQRCGGFVAGWPLAASGWPCGCP